MRETVKREWERKKRRWRWGGWINRGDGEREREEKRGGEEREVEKEMRKKRKGRKKGRKKVERTMEDRMERKEKRDDGMKREKGSKLREGETERVKDRS